LVLARDETERLRLEERLRDAQKMEAMGQLAGGVAHDFNNLLTVLFGALEFAREHARVPSALGHDLDDIEAAATRARALVARLLAFTRQQVVQIREVSLNRVVAQVEPLLRRVLGESITLHIDLASDDPLIQADGGQLEQVLLNLALNAREAMVRPAAGAAQGTLFITTRLLEHRAVQASEWPGLAVGLCVELEVHDTGCGMSDDTMRHAFEPFFTTKPLGTATGLGLSSVLGLVQQFGGAMSVESTLGVGSSFRVRFPAKMDMAPRSTSGSHAAVSDTAGTVLLAEDEPTVRTAVRRMLQMLGYRVIEAPDGAVALSTWRAHRDEIDPLVTDIRMPRMNGRDLAHAIRDESPTFPVVFASGFADEGLADFTVHDRFVDKPFTCTTLREALAAVRGAAT
jgi:nitrogen-specific signal transduction histidine kinase/CheY-like chemotaxis protein